MILHYKGFSAICEQLECGLWTGWIVQLPNESQSLTDENINNLEWKFHVIVDKALKQEANEGEQL